ncbi:MAG: hypothetical protein EPN82_11030 [Bacteroidetes bacterium]|nr:MAG: hypothetical protein EPN82_11030 [Bacteroidota bacterium]
MKDNNPKSPKTLKNKYKPSKPCSCEVCVGFCKRPSWWTVEEAGLAIESGYAKRMMLEMAPELTFGVLSPAFKGCEGNFALNTFSKNGCNFFKDNLCELHGTGLQPFECRISHHDRPGMGKKCHADIEKDWNTQSGQSLIMKWGNITGLWVRYQIRNF